MKYFLYKGFRMVLLSDLMGRYIAAVADDMRVRDQVVCENLRRIRLGALLVLPIFIVAAVLLLPGTWQAHDGAVVSWKLAVGLTHLASLCCALVIAVLAHRALHRNPAGRLGRVLPVAAAVVTLLIGLALTLFYQWVMPKTSPMVVTALGVAMLLFLRPAVSAVLFVGLAVLGFVALPLTQHDPALLASGRISALVIPLVALAFSILSWRKNTVNILLSRSLAQANATLAAKQVELERLAWHDGLTGLCNRTEFMRRANQELLRALRHQHPTSFLLLDLDHFKRVNDHYGHPTGDAVLCHVAHLLTQSVRSTDLVARLGGEEFIVLLPQTGLDAALQCAEKLRLAVQNQPLATEAAGPLHITVSLGVVEVPHDAGADMTAAYAAIDRALYLAKKGGRNRVEVGVLQDGFRPTEPARLVA